MAIKFLEKRHRNGSLKFEAFAANESEVFAQIAAGANNRTLYDTSHIIC